MLSCFSHVHLFTTLWTIAQQAPLSMGLCRQKYWNGLPFPTPGIDIYTLLYIQETTNKDLLYSTGNYTQYSVIACKVEESEIKTPLYTSAEKKKEQTKYWLWHIFTLGVLRKSQLSDPQSAMPSNGENSASEQGSHEDQSRQSP